MLSLTLIRMLPVAVALLGAGFDRATVAFVGWFGPRGLASVIFALLALDDLDGAAHEAIDVIALTVLLSVLAHGSDGHAARPTVRADPEGRRAELIPDRAAIIPSG